MGLGGRAVGPSRIERRRRLMRRGIASLRLSDREVEAAEGGNWYLGKPWLVCFSFLLYNIKRMRNRAI